MEQKRTVKYKSPSTDGVEHDVFNLIVEAIMINRYGMIPAGAWRKGSALAFEWGDVVKVVKRLAKSMKVDPMRIAWYVKKYDVTGINYNEFGLVRYKICKFFGWENMENFRQHYETRYKSMVGVVSPYVETTTGYSTKEAAPPRKTLQEILQEIENGIE